MEEDLITAYMNAEYRVEGFSEPIYIGEHSEDADNILSKNSLMEWAYIRILKINKFKLLFRNR